MKAAADKFSALRTGVPAAVLALVLVQALLASGSAAAQVPAQAQPESSSYLEQLKAAAAAVDQRREAEAQRDALAQAVNAARANLEAARATFADDAGNPEMTLGGRNFHKYLAKMVASEQQVVAAQQKFEAAQLTLNIELARQGLPAQRSELPKSAAFDEAMRLWREIRAETGSAAADAARDLRQTP